MINVEEGATAEFVELHHSSGGSSHYANAVTEIRVAPGARARWLQVQQRAADHLMTSSTAVSVSADAGFLGGSMQLGGRMVRNAVDMIVDGQAARAEVTGLTITDDVQHIDNRVFAHHAKPGGTTRQHYRAIAAGRSRNVFNSKALVSAGADGTDAEQSSHNLLLSEEAEIDTKPELEIYADDVKCAHGATVGELDAAALFYLRSRGIEENQARQILTRAFADQIVDRLPVAAAKAFAEQAISEKLKRVIGAVS